MLDPCYNRTINEFKVDDKIGYLYDNKFLLNGKIYLINEKNNKLMIVITGKMDFLVKNKYIWLTIPNKLIFSPPKKDFELSSEEIFLYKLSKRPKDEFAKYLRENKCMLYLFLK